MLSAKDLIPKLTMLMVLVSTCRGSELLNMHSILMSEKTDEVIFHITGLTKSKRLSMSHISITFQEYLDEPRLDVIRCLITYLALTKNSRLFNKRNESLFPSYNAPFQPVTTCSIIRWLKVITKEAELNTSVFIAYSTRTPSGKSRRKTSRLLRSLNEQTGQKSLRSSDIRGRCYQPKHFEQAILYLFKAYEIKLEIV